MKRTSDQLLRYILSFSLIVITQALIFSFSLNVENYPWLDEFIEVLILSFVFNLFSFAVYVIFFKIVIRQTALLVRALITALLCTLCYYLLVSRSYTGARLDYKLIVILTCFFVGCFSIPYLETLIFRRTNLARKH